MRKKALLITFALFACSLFPNTAAHAMSITIKDSATVSSSSVYKMIHHEISGNDYLLVAAGASGLLIYQTTDSGISDTPVGSIDTTGTAQDVVAYGNYAYVADGFTQSGLQTRGHMFVYDISNPTSPTLVYDDAVLAGNISALDVSADGSTLYMADKVSGIHIFSIITPTAPTEIGTYVDGISAVDLVIDGTKLYILEANASASTGALQIIDVGTPSTPTLLGTVAVDPTSSELTINGNLAYIASGTTGLVLYDCSNAALPAALGIYDSPGTARAISFINSTAGILADSSSGVEILAFNGSSGLTPLATENTTITSAVDTVVDGDRIFVLSNGIYELTLSYSFAVSGSKSGKTEKITVTESGTNWCTITVSDKAVGAKAVLADLDGDGQNDDIAEAPIDAMKNPKVRVYSASSCALLSQKKMDDSGNKYQYVMNAGNYYGSTSSKDEIVATRVMDKDGQTKAQMLSFFLNSSNELKQKANGSFVVPSQLKSQGFKIKIKEGNSYPVTLQAKDDSSITSLFQLAKNDSSFVWKQK